MAHEKSSQFASYAVSFDFLNVYSLGKILTLHYCKEKVARNFVKSVEKLNDAYPDWDTMLMGADGKELPFHCVMLSKASEEYRKVKRELSLTSRGTIKGILSIQRIQNPKLYMSYMIRKQAMDKRNESSNNERYLFHGTSKESSEAINHNGFNRSYAGKHGK